MRPQLVTIEPIQVVPPGALEPPPTEVTLLDDDSVATKGQDASSARNRSKTRQQDVVGSRGTTTLEAAPGSPERTNERTNDPSKRSSLMTMRHPTIEKGPSADFWSKFEANTKPLAPKDIAGEQLSSEIATAEGNLKNRRWVENASPEQLAAEREKLAAKRYEKSTAELQPDGDGTKADHRTFTARFNPDGTIASLDDKANLQRKGLGAEFDITDGLMRSKGIDPYSSYKLKVLDDTREERAAIGKRYRTQQLARSREYVQKNLDHLWASTNDLVARKRGLFELWDDCAETGSAELVAGGAAARAHVIGFIRAKLPPGGADAYTATELARFNKQRKSRATFTPYEVSL
jgi:hypothetical protein